jgi:Malic enzyme, NAD binding domain
VSNPAGHLTDNFHLLGLLKRRFRLLSFTDFLMKNLIGLLELACSSFNEAFQLKCSILTIQQVLPDLILAAPRPQRCTHCTDQGDAAERGKLDQREPANRRHRNPLTTRKFHTAGVALVGIFAALRLTRQKLAEQRFLYLGAGSAATGIAGLISLAMACDGIDLATAQRRNALFDSKGLLVTLTHRPRRFSEAFRTGPGGCLDVRRGSRGAAANWHHRHQHRAEVV